MRISSEYKKEFRDYFVLVRRPTMKKITILSVLFLLALLVGCQTKHRDEQSQPVSTVEITFDFNRIEKDYANNQFAVWIEDLKGNLVKTIFVTQFTAKKGWKEREEALPVWTKKSDIASLKKKQVDAISGATPTAQTLTYEWKGDNAEGDYVEAGEYKYFVEANCLWANEVIYSGNIHIGEKENSSIAEAWYSSDEASKYQIIENVSAKYIPIDSNDSVN